MVDSMEVSRVDSSAITAAIGSIGRREIALHFKEVSVMNFSLTKTVASVARGGFVNG
jgi:hypothetical protein